MSGRRRPTRRRRAELSQHFLRDACARRLVRATSITQTDLVVEIGPGRGALTQPLAARAGRVIGVEIDAHLVDRLRARCAGNTDIVVADFLQFELPAGPYRVVGNVPFARTADIVRRIIQAPTPPQDAWLVVQRELAYRLCGPPFARESLWSLRLKPCWHLEIVERLERTEFDPPPSVESVFLQMSSRGRPIVHPRETRQYLELLQLGFRGRGTLAQALKPRLTKRQLRRLAADFRFAADAGPADLSFDQWLGIFRFVQRTARPVP